jgi:hypothetical protein
VASTRWIGTPPSRILLSCKTHAATDVLLGKVLEVQQLLRELRQQHPALFERYFDARLLDVPLFRIAPRQAPADGIEAVSPDGEGGGGKAADMLQRQRRCIVGGAPAGVFRTISTKWSKDLYGHRFIDCLCWMRRPR